MTTWHKGSPPSVGWWRTHETAEEYMDRVTIARKIAVSMLTEMPKGERE